MVSANLHWGVGRFGADDGRRLDVPAVLREYAADVFVLPEAFRPDDGPSFLDALAADGYEIVETRFRRLRFEGRRSYVDDTNGVGWWELAVASRLPVLRTEAVRMRSSVRDRVPERHVLKVTIAVDGHPVELFALHTSSKIWWGASLWQVLGLRKVARTVDTPRVLAGDWNLWGPPSSLCMRGYRRAVRGATFPAHRPHSQIDHVFVNHALECLDGEVLPPYGSDHRAIRARLRVRTAAHS